MKVSYRLFGGTVGGGELLRIHADRAARKGNPPSEGDAGDRKSRASAGSVEAEILALTGPAERELTGAHQVDRRQC